MKRSLMTLALARCAPGGPKARLSILIYHRVLLRRDDILSEIPDAGSFDEQMRWVAALFNVLPLAEAVERLQRGALPERALAITFDDGYADNATVAAPILRSLGLSATFFVTTGFVDGGRMWNDTVIESVRAAPCGDLNLSALGLGQFQLDGPGSRRHAIDSILSSIKRRSFGERERLVDGIAEHVGAELPDRLMMTSDQVRSLGRQGMDIGGHTVTHPILTRLDDASARLEISKARDDLQQMSGAGISLFAYPNGVPDVDYDARHVEMVRQSGYAAAVSTAHGVAVAGSDVFQLPRFTPWDRTELRFGVRMIRNLLRDSYRTA